MMVPRFYGALAVLSVLSVVCHGKPSQDTIVPARNDELSVPPFLEDLRDRCLNMTGSERTIEELVQYMTTDMPKCFVKYVNMEQLKVDTVALGAKEQAVLFEKICDQVNQSLVCITPIKTIIEPCLDSENAQLIVVVLASIPEALNMACVNSGALLLKLSEPAYRSGAMALPPMTMECASVLHRGVDHIPFAQYKEEQCREMDNMRDCFAQKFDEFGASGYMDFFMVFYRKLLALTPCK